MLMATTVAAVGTFFVLFQDNSKQARESVRTDIPLSETVGVERCYSKSNFTHLSLRNSDREAHNFSELTLLVNGKRTSFKLDDGVVDPKQTTVMNTTVRFNPGKKNLELVGRTRTKSIRCEAENQRSLTADFSFEPLNPQVGEEVKFNASESYDPLGKIRYYRWSWEAGSSYQVLGEEPDHTYTNPGSKQVTLEVATQDHYTDRKSKTVNVQPSPNADPSSDFDQVQSYLTVDFSSAANDPDGSVVDYQWDFGDGETASIKNPSHRYSSTGTYSVTLQVTDDDGATDSATKTISVDDDMKIRLLSIGKSARQSEGGNSPVPPDGGTSDYGGIYWANNHTPIVEGKRSYSIALYNETSDEFYEKETFDVYSSVSEAEAMKNFFMLNDAENVITFMVTSAEPKKNRQHGTLENHMESSGVNTSFAFGSIANESAYAVVGSAESPESPIKGVYRGPSDSSPDSWVDFNYTIEN